MNSASLSGWLVAGLLLCLFGDPLRAEHRVLIPSAKDGGSTWRYTTETPGADWAQADFDDAQWAEGRAGFGVTDQVTPQVTVGTPWRTSNLWLRKTIEVSVPLAFASAALIVRHDEDVEVYLNGDRVFSAAGFNTAWMAFDVTQALQRLLRAGKNAVAVHVAQSGGGQYIDLSLVLDPTQKLVAPVEPLAGEELQALRDARWSKERARSWYARVRPIFGCNYLPRTAVNMTEMWQKETFDPTTIDEELGWAERVGYNSLRVFVQYLVWKDDPEGLKERLDDFLTIAQEHGMRVMLVPFCDCAFAGREPYLGKQDEPVPGVHNSGWVPSPGLKRVVDRGEWPNVERYLKDLVERFGKDGRVLIWDLYNEPGNSRQGEKSLPLAAAAFRWAREAKPTQPLTIGAWTRFESRMSKALMEMSDVVSYHGYDQPDGMRRKIAICKAYDRPVLCTEWLHRQSGNSFQTILPIFASEGVGAYQWGLVAGRTQTYMPWGSKKGDPVPELWQHDVFHSDGTPYKAEEIALVQQHLEGERRKCGPEEVDYQGWQAYLLRNDFVQLHVVPAIGGRVMQYTLGAKDFFWIDPALTGKTAPQTGLGPDGGWLNYGGDKLWPAPQGWDNDEQWPGPPDAVLDGQPYTAQLYPERSAISLTSRDDPRSGIRFQRDLRLYPDSTRVSIEATMTNIDEKPRRWGIWAHTQLDAGVVGSDDYNRLMRAWCPINPRSRFDRGYRVMFGEEDNPSFEVDADRGLMKVSYGYKVGKIGLDSDAGWVATVDGRTGDVFVQRFTFEQDKEYPDESSVEFWHNGVGRIRAYNKWIDMAEDPVANPYVFESEVLSPFARLQPGESFSWRYDWYACRIGGDFPVVDCTEAGLVSEQLSAQPVGTRVRVRGRFGVFHRGRLVLETSDGQGEVVGRQVLAANAAPLRAVVLDRSVDLQAGAHSIALVLQDAEEKEIGAIARLSLKP